MQLIKYSPQPQGPHLTAVAAGLQIIIPRRLLLTVRYRAVLLQILWLDSQQQRAATEQQTVSSLLCHSAGCKSLFKLTAPES